MHPLYFPLFSQSPFCLHFLSLSLYRSHSRVQIKVCRDPTTPVEPLASALFRGKKNQQLTYEACPSRSIGMDLRLTWMGVEKSNAWRALRKSECQEMKTEHFLHEFCKKCRTNVGNKCHCSTWQDVWFYVGLNLWNLHDQVHNLGCK